jgi:hypothetical protein
LFAGPSYRPFRQRGRSRRAGADALPARASVRLHRAIRLGWTSADEAVHRLPDGLGRAATIAFVDAWAQQRQSLLLAIRSAVLPEADVILMNAAHPAAAAVPPLVVRPFRFDACLHRPPMLDQYS